MDDGEVTGPSTANPVRRWRPSTNTGPGIITEEVLREAFVTMGGEMLGFARRSLFDSQLGDDAVQETFARAWRSRSSFDPGKGSLRTWLYTIEHRVIIDMIRLRAGSGPDGSDPQVEATTMDGLEEAITSWQVEDALKRLHADHRQVIEELYLHDRSGPEVAALLEIPEGTVRSRAYYALKSLRVLLNEQGWEQ
jgi:RNA polymerase sigma-70 factor (ECF subfamily)